MTPSVTTLLTAIAVVFFSKQVAAQPAIDSYKEVGVGYCLDKDGVQYPDVLSDVTTPDQCADNCECARGIKGVQFRGFTYSNGACHCQMDWLNPAKDQEVIDELNAACAGVPSVGYEDAGGDYKGKGSIKSSDEITNYTCYKLMSKSGKSTKTPKSLI
jgi:hypothetical protein